MQLLLLRQLICFLLNLCIFSFLYLLLWITLTATAAWFLTCITCILLCFTAIFLFLFLFSTTTAATFLRFTVTTTTGFFILFFAANTFITTATALWFFLKLIISFSFNLWLSFNLLGFRIICDYDSLLQESFFQNSVVVCCLFRFIV